MAGHDVFISYSTLDKPTADAVCHGLEAEGVRCWIAPRDVTPGMDWQQSLLDAIAAAKAVVLVFTGNANASANVRKEITAAFEGGAVVIPFRLEDIEPQGSLRYHLTGVHWLDALTPPLESHVRGLAASVRRVLGKDSGGTQDTVFAPPPPPPVPPPPREPPPDALRVGLMDAGTGAAVSDQATARRTGPPSWLVPAAVGGGIVAIILFVLLIIAGLMASGDDSATGSGSGSASGLSGSVVASGSGSASGTAVNTTATLPPSPERQAAIAALRAVPADAREIDNELQPVENGPPTAIQGGSVVTTQQLVLALAQNQNLQQITLVDALGCADHVSLPTARCASTTDNIGQLLTAAQIDRDAPVVFFCHGPDCPNSYVMALSAIQAGWTNVFWYRGGLRAWQSLGGPTASPAPLDPTALPPVSADQPTDMGQGAGAPTN